MIFPLRYISFLTRLFYFIKIEELFKKTLCRQVEIVIVIVFFFHKCQTQTFVIMRFAAKKRFNPQSVIGRTTAVTQHLLYKSFFITKIYEKNI